MTLITGTLKDSGGNLLSGTLTVTLDGFIVDVGTTPNTIYAADPAVFTIVSGAISLTLAQSQTQNTTYHFVFAFNTPQIQYFLQDGTLYTGPTHLHTDSQYYTGTVHTVDSKVLSRVEVSVPTEVLNFHAIVPNVASVNFSQLLPTGIADSVLDTAIASLASLLTTNSSYAQALRGGPVPQGTYVSTTYYRHGDAVAYAGSSWLYVNANPAAGQVPTPINTTYWQQIAAKGDPGGTGGQDTPYDATGWDGQTWAPTANVLRDVIITLATTAQLATYAPLNNAALTGNPSRTAAPTLGDRSSQLSTTQWVGNEFALVASPTFTGNPAAPTQSITDASGKLATTLFVSNFFAGLLKNTPIFVARKTATQALSTGNNTLSFDSEDLDSDNAFTPTTSLFTVPTGKAGWYEFTAQAYVTKTSGTSIDSAIEFVASGGARVWRVAHALATTVDVILTGSAQIYLTDGQTLTMRIAVNQAGGTGVASNAASASLNLTTFSGKRLIT